MKIAKIQICTLHKKNLMFRGVHTEGADHQGRLRQVKVVLVYHVSRTYKSLGKPRMKKVFSGKKKNPGTSFFYRFIQSVQSPTTRHLEPVWVFMKQKVFWGALDQLDGSLSDIGAHQYLQKPKFVTPELINVRTMLASRRL